MVDEKTRDEIEELVTLYCTTERKILDKISLLPNNGKECDCDYDERNQFDILDDDNIVSYCLNCGGDISN